MALTRCSYSPLGKLGGFAPFFSQFSAVLNGFAPFFGYFFASFYLSNSNFHPQKWVGLLRFIQQGTFNMPIIINGKESIMPVQIERDEHWDVVSVGEAKNFE